MNEFKDITEEDWLILGMIHAFRSLSIVKEQDGDINEVDFEHLIEIQKRQFRGRTMGVVDEIMGQ